RSTASRRPAAPGSWSTASSARCPPTPPSSAPPPPASSSACWPARATGRASPTGWSRRRWPSTAPTTTSSAARTRSPT
ncbi:MAG: Regulatory protein RecX, partial [uncultured Pseudonocardia sp.]